MPWNYRDTLAQCLARKDRLRPGRTSLAEFLKRAFQQAKSDYVFGQDAERRKCFVRVTLPIDRRFIVGRRRLAHCFGVRKVELDVVNWPYKAAQRS